MNINEVNEKKQITGGLIEFKSNSNNIVYYTFIVVLIILCIYLIYYMCIHYFFNTNEDYYQRLTHDNFNNLHGDTFDENAKNTIYYGNLIPNPRAIDHYRMGTAYLVNAHDPKQARDCFYKALNSIQRGDIDNREALYILNKIDDYKDYFVDFPDIEELPIQQMLLDNYNNTRTILQQVKIEKNEIKTDDPNFTQKTILARKYWQNDSQNVHDSAIYEELKNQFVYAINKNAQVEELEGKTYAELSHWLKIRYKDEKDNYTKITKVLNILNNNYSTDMIIPNTTEQDIVLVIWKLIHHPDNKDNLHILKEAFGDAFLDCVENENVVCISGRLPKYWQSLALLEKNPVIGIIKTKQLIINEIYDKCASIVNVYIGPNGSVSSELKDAYNNNENTEQVKELIKHMKQQIDDLRPQYENLLPISQLNLILEECKEII